MSEKRFILAEDSNGLFSIFDNEDPEGEPLIYAARFGTEKVCDLLNEFNDENKELKAEIEQSDSISEDIVCADIQHQLLKVTDENKELKKENKKLIEDWEFSFRTEMAHHRFAEKELQEKIRRKQARIKELEKENEQLRHEIEIEKKWQLEKDKYYVKIKEENDGIKTKGLDVLAFYESKLKDVVGTEDFQCARDEIWIVRQVLYEMGVIDDE